MRKTYSYNEAVKILGGSNHPVVDAMDKLLGGALLAGSLGLWEVLSLFDAKPDFIKLSNELITKLSRTRREASRYSRTQQLHAAHAIVVMTAFFEACAEQQIKLDSSDERLTTSNSPWQMELPLPSADRPYEQNLMVVEHLYLSLGDLVHFNFGVLDSWNQRGQVERDRLRDVVTRVVPERALERYEELLAQLAADHPEVGFWCSTADGMATRKALAGLEDVLREIMTARTPAPWIAELAGAYEGALRRPLAKDVPGGVRIPSLEEAYVDPRFQVFASTESFEAPSLLEWWGSVPARDDLHAYLVGYLTSPQALSAPLLVLGDPGSGKSVLTEMLAARLPAEDYAVVRVELRNTPADAGLDQQIEHGLRLLLQESVSWADFCREAGGALPVVILDGFDELLQATGVSQTRYLSAIADFQQRIEDMGRPAAFVVTSRLSVRAGLELPQGTQVVRLMPFDNDQVRAWLEVWNAVNRPLPAATVLDYPDLASQPLLLLMLALYDAVDSSFQRDHLGLSRGQLYERLLTQFAQREVVKGLSNVSAADLGSDVEVELERLSVVALAMFNRGVQWVAEHAVTSDLGQLLGMESAERLSGTRTPLTAGEKVLGRFFFVQKSEAVRDDLTKLRTYEFLHATFGEYLVARFVWDRLLELHREDATRSRRKNAQDDTELYTVLAHMSLTTSKPVLDFLRERSDTPDRDELFDLVSRLLAQRDDTRKSRGDYEPTRLSDSARDAKYSLNLVVLALALKGEISSGDLGLNVEDWQRLTLFWKSRVSSGEWASVVRALWVLPVEGTQRFTLALGDRTESYLPMAEPYVTLDEVSLTLCNAVRPLAEKYGIDVAGALAGLDGATDQEWLPALQRLRDADKNNVVFWHELYARLGTGGDDLALMRAFADHTTGIPVYSQLDCLLRLHDLGVDGTEVDEFRFGLASALERLSQEKVPPLPPYLVKRARRAAEELGIRLNW
ncbi:NACHT domain-containing protein [Lentzea sp. JNUCC 0626]|uniref:NACHT domain-containing protein n=1 Tax=Lentzea sp. JNUCC 0626 TaxID=3367513 RepID=UPI00374A33B9